MADETLRHRYRHDYTAEKIVVSPASAAAKPSAQIKPTGSMFGPNVEPKISSIGSDFFKNASRLSLARDISVFVGVVVIVVLAIGIARSKNRAPNITVVKPKTQVVTNSTPKTLGESTTPNTGSSSVASTNPQATSDTGNLPPSFHVNNDKQTANGVTTYSISDNANNTYNVVEEPITATNTLDSFAKSLSNTETLTVHKGSAVIGETSAEALAGIQTSDNILIIIEAPSPSLRTQLDALTKSL
ncbi:MAG TPA: hypothetical protein VMT23_02390 [Candidatus Binatia bacterium]|nr:hypothetical protein [Candidatus Binatia bacterium]